jgi:hypothetical protein
MKKRYCLLIVLPAALFAVLFSTCDYGTVGGADVTITRVSPADRAIMAPMAGVWYSHYAKRKLDSYRIGRWADRDTLIPPEKRALFPGFDINNPKFRGVSATISNDDYIVFYDDTVFENEAGDGGNGGWAGLVTRYIGVVRAVNLFHYESSGAGAFIIEYFDGACPTWDQDIYRKPLPFFGIYYRVINANCIQMANAVMLENLAAGQKYYTETATLAEAIAKNSADNDGEFIAWGIVIPQDRE